GRFFRDLHVVDVRFTNTGGRDLYEFGLVAHLFDGSATAVTHGRPYTADQLVDDRDDAALVGHAAFNAFRNQLVDVVAGILEIAIRGTVRHGTQAAHAAIGLVRTSLIQHDLTGSFLRAGEHATHHARRSACGQCLGDVARIANAAIRDQRNTGTLKRFRDIGNGRDLRHTHTGHNTRGADRARPDTHF